MAQADDWGRRFSLLNLNFPSCALGVSPKGLVSAYFVLFRCLLGKVVCPHVPSYYEEIMEQGKVLVQPLTRKEHPHLSHSRRHCIAFGWAGTSSHMVLFNLNIFPLFHLFNLVYFYYFILPALGLCWGVQALHWARRISLSCIAQGLFFLLSSMGSRTPRLSSCGAQA